MQLSRSEVPSTNGNLLAPIGEMKIVRRLGKELGELTFLGRRDAIGRCLSEWNSTCYPAKMKEGKLEMSVILEDVGI